MNVLNLTIFVLTGSFNHDRIGARAASGIVSRTTQDLTSHGLGATTHGAGVRFQEGALETQEMVSTATGQHHGVIFFQITEADHARLIRDIHEGTGHESEHQIFAVVFIIVGFGVINIMPGKEQIQNALRAAESAHGVFLIWEL